MNKKPLLLCILDGWGMSDNADHNAVTLADTPTFDMLMSECPHTLLHADSAYVGLPDGQFGNSEVGHINIGAGRVVMQELPRINKAVKENTLVSSDAMQQLIATQTANGGAVHVMGLISTGGVHAHRDHITALVKILDDAGIATKIHIFTDGRDVAPSSAKDEVNGFLASLHGLHHVQIATISGRYFAMDRDNRWERVEQAWKVIARAEGVIVPNALAALEQSYAASVTDEFLVPSVIDGYHGIGPDDAILMGNYRTDRAREILRSLLSVDFTGFDRGDYTPPKFAAGMVDYSDDLAPLMHSIFAPQNLSDIFGEVISKAGRTQVRIAETEKYPHVTFFFNNQIETPYPGEDRILVPSPKVATYDLQPEMSAFEVTEKTIAAIRGGRYDVFVLNFANPDMVGHSGLLAPTIKAVETVDACLGHILAALKEQDGTALIIADHGNAEQMIDPVTHEPHTAHTTNLVPCILFNGPANAHLRPGGHHGPAKLADIAPTMLQLLGIPQPEAMTGQSLLD